jgi:hypothetical protein
MVNEYLTFKNTGSLMAQLHLPCTLMTAMDGGNTGNSGAIASAKLI